MVACTASAAALTAFQSDKGISRPSDDDEDEPPEAAAICSICAQTTGSTNELTNIQMPIHKNTEKQT
jgi:hypothetical protein